MTHGNSPAPDRRTRIHDLKTVHYDFQTVLRLLNSGYRFDDEDAPPVLAQLEKALKMLNTEIDRLKSEWGGT